MIFDSFSDIIKHTSGLGLVENLKLIGTDEGARIEAMDENRTVIIQGELKEPVPNLNSTVGLSRTSVLNGYLNFSPFASKTAKVSIVTQPKGDTVVPSEISFDSGSGHTANYRFMSAEIANEQIKVPPFRGAAFAVEIEPTKAAITDLVKLSSILGSFESTFTVKTDGDKLQFLIGSSATDRSSLNFATGITTKLARQWSYPLTQMLSILKLYDSSNKVKMFFSDSGIVKVEVDSSMGKYTYLVPAKVN